MATATAFDLTGSWRWSPDARRGIGLAMAEALAAAGADIIGVSATLEPAGSDGRARGSRPPGARFDRIAADLADRDAVRRARPQTSPRRRPGRHPGQQRRHDPRARPAAEHTDERLGPRPRKST